MSRKIFLICSFLLFEAIGLQSLSCFHPVYADDGDTPPVVDSDLSQDVKVSFAPETDQILSAEDISATETDEKGNVDNLTTNTGISQGESEQLAAINSGDDTSGDSSIDQSSDNSQTSSDASPDNQTDDNATNLDNPDNNPDSTN